MNEKRKFTHGAVSPSDPNQAPMRYYSREDAEAHARDMNALIETWEENPRGLWSKDYWKTKPEPWIVKELE
jgi:hypothetical protein